MPKKLKNNQIMENDVKTQILESLLKVVKNKDFLTKNIKSIAQEIDPKIVKGDTTKVFNYASLLGGLLDEAAKKNYRSNEMKGVVGLANENFTNHSKANQLNSKGKKNQKEFYKLGVETATMVMDEVVRGSSIDSQPEISLSQQKSENSVLKNTDIMKNDKVEELINKAFDSTNDPWLKNIIRYQKLEEFKKSLKDNYLSDLNNYRPEHEDYIVNSVILGNANSYKINKSDNRFSKSLEESTKNLTDNANSISKNSIENSVEQNSPYLNSDHRKYATILANATIKEMLKDPESAKKLDAQMIDSIVKDSVSFAQTHGKMLDKAHVQPGRLERIAKHAVNDKSVKAAEGKVTGMFAQKFSDVFKSQQKSVKYKLFKGKDAERFTKIQNQVDKAVKAISGKFNKAGKSSHKGHSKNVSSNKNKGFSIE